jgi:hydroxyacyl-ACP dehydratase HTD2-like protein with hotdog domain
MSLHTRCLARTSHPPAHRTQWRRIRTRCYASSAADDPAWFQLLRREMVGRAAISSRERIDGNTHQKLVDTLSTFLPPEWCRHLSPRGFPPVPLGHHLVWFNPSIPADKLMPDGTDPLQSPGGPWVRRMWAGGSLQLAPDAYYHQDTGFVINADLVYAERIRDVQLRGQDEAAKIFVTLERRFARQSTLEERKGRDLPQTYFRAQIQAEDWGEAILKEQRNLVFLRDRNAAELDAIRTGESAPIRYLERWSSASIP